MVSQFRFQILITILWIQMFIIIQCKKDTSLTMAPPVQVLFNESFINAFGNDSFLTDSVLNLLNKDSSLASIIQHSILNVDDSMERLKIFKAYFKDSSRIQFRDTLKSIFEQRNWKKSLTAALARYHQTFPAKSIPSFYLVLSDFNYGIFLFRDDHGMDALGIGMEMFMGDPAFYDPLSVTNTNFSSYLNRTFNLDHLVSKIMVAILTEWLPAPANNRILDHLLYEGKKLYFLKKWIPDIQDSVLYEYTPEQCRWVKDNEMDIWRFLLTDKLIYKKSGKDVANLIQPAPHSQGMPPEAPGRAVNYIGLRVIESLMKKDKISDQELADLKDYDALLRMAKYHPR